MVERLCIAAFLAAAIVAWLLFDRAARRAGWGQVRRPDPSPLEAELARLNAAMAESARLFAEAMRPVILSVLEAIRRGGATYTIAMPPPELRGWRARLRRMRP